MIEPLYPRLGLLGGAPEAGGKVSKLAALAQARKKKESEKTASMDAAPTSQAEELVTPDSRSPARSLAERLAANSRTPKPEGGLRRFGKPVSPAPSPVQEQPVSKVKEPATPVELASKPQSKSVEIETPEMPEPQPVEPVIRASPSMFASTIVGDTAGPTMAEPSHLDTTSVDLLKIYGQDHAEPFDFAGPSPDDVVLNAQNTAKGLAILNKVQKPLA